MECGVLFERFKTDVDRLSVSAAQRVNAVHELWILVVQMNPWPGNVAGPPLPIG